MIIEQKGGIPFIIGSRQHGGARHAIDSVDITGRFEGDPRKHPIVNAIVGAVSHAHQLGQSTVHFRAPTQPDENNAFTSQNYVAKVGRTQQGTYEVTIYHQPQPEK